LEVKDYFIFLVFGKVAIYFLQIFPPIRKIKSQFLSELIDCDLCTGVYVYIALCLIFGISLNPKGNWLQNVISKILTGASSSLLVHLVSIGWKEKFGIFNFNTSEE
jgi:hypothetical protein